MQTPFKTEGMTTEELIAYHGDTIADVTYKLALFQPPLLTVTVLYNKLAWKGEYYSTDTKWYLAAISASAGESCTPKPEHVRHILNQVRKAMS